MLETRFSLFMQFRRIHFFFKATKSIDLHYCRDIASGSSQFMKVNSLKRSLLFVFNLLHLHAVMTILSRVWFFLTKVLS